MDRGRVLPGDMRGRVLPWDCSWVSFVGCSSPPAR